MPPEFDQNPNNHPDQLTWAALIARWTDFARASVALPQDGEGGAWRASVAPAIGLQAVTLALHELHRLPADERAHGLDLASVLIRRHAGELNEAWRARPMPEKLTELVGDARKTHAAAAALGVEFTVAVDRLVMPSIDELGRSLLAGGFAGDLLAARAGTVLFRDEPALFVRPDARDIAIEDLERGAGLTLPRQVYRQANAETGRATRDVVAPMPFALRPGQPLLRQVIEGGELIAGLDGAQDAAGAPESLPVVFEEQG